MEINLVWFRKDGSPKSCRMPGSITVIGRGHDCDLRIPIESVSRRHCRLSTDQKSLEIRDLGSQNGTFLNGKRIEKAQIQPGDFMRIGPVKFVIQIDGKPENISPLNIGEKEFESRKKIKEENAFDEQFARFEQFQEDAAETETEETENSQQLN